MIDMIHIDKIPADLQMISYSENIPKCILDVVQTPEMNVTRTQSPADAVVRGQWARGA